jgi:hypothetical protein
MGAAVSLALFALGAIFTFAVNAHPSGLSIQTVGVILMIVAVVGFGVALYRDRWRRRIVEDSIEQGAEPEMSLDDDSITIETTTPRPDHVVHEVVHDRVVTDDEPAGRRRYVDGPTA